MGKHSGLVRRIAGIVCLSVPVAMFVLGQTALKASLQGEEFLIYWLTCFLFTFAAMFIALGELRAVRRQTRRETEELLEETLKEVARQQEEKRKDFL